MSPGSRGIRRRHFLNITNAAQHLTTVPRASQLASSNNPAIQLGFWQITTRQCRERAPRPCFLTWLKFTQASGGMYELHGGTRSLQRGYCFSDIADRSRPCRGHKNFGKSTKWYDIVTFASTSISITNAEIIRLVSGLFLRLHLSLGSGRLQE